MCGLTGFSGSSKFRPDKIKMLMLANMTRGVHATGMFVNGEITKEADDAITFFASHELEADKIFIGHDRAATIGNKTNPKNAHPFQYGTTVGVHNGTLKNHWDLVKKNGKEWKDFDVDSQVLIWLLDKNKDFKVLQEFEGAAAIIWHDTDVPNRLYVFRNEDRPLFRGYRKEGMYISSIEDSLKLIGCERVQSFKTQYLYVIEDGEINIKESKRIVVRKKSFVNDYIRNKDRNNNRSTSGGSSSYSIDKRCDWVKRTSNIDTGLFIKDKWYKIIGTRGTMYDLISERGSTMASTVSYFSDREDLNLNAYVIAPIGDGQYIKDGEILYLRGLEIKDGVTYAVLEKVNDSKSVYTWPKHYVRNLESKELEELMKESNENSSGVRKSEEFSQEKVDFIEDEANFDEGSNRLGLTWIEVGSTYEDLISISHFVEDIKESIEDIIQEGTEAERDNLLLDLSVSAEDLSKEISNVIKDIVEKSYETNGKYVG